MKRNLSVSFKESDNESTPRDYYGSRVDTPMPGASWSICGIDSTASSPQPTPPSSPRLKNKPIRIAMDETAEQFSNMLSHKAPAQEDYSLPRAGLYFSSISSTPPTSAEDLLNRRMEQQKSQPSLIAKNKKGQTARHARRRG